MNLDQKYTDYSIRTYTGKTFDLSRPTVDMICKEDIAHGLSNTARWAGQTEHFYSVAQHSVMVSQLLPPELRLAGLMHDASESYMGDMPSPFKKLMPSFKKLEGNLMRVIFEKYDIDWSLMEKIKEVDREVLGLEWDNVVTGPNCLPVWSPEFAKVRFLETYELIKTQSDGKGQFTGVTSTE